MRAFERAGYTVDRQKGSHIQMRQAAPPHRRLTVPDHRTLGKGLLRALIRDAGLTVEEFHELLRQSGDANRGSPRDCGFEVWRAWCQRMRRRLTGA